MSKPYNIHKMTIVRNSFEYNEFVLDDWSQGCCWYIDDFFHLETKEFKLFSKMFKGKKSSHYFWFGSPYKKKNQLRRLEALDEWIAEARRLNAKMKKVK